MPKTKSIRPRAKGRGKLVWLAVPIGVAFLYERGGPVQKVEGEVIAVDPPAKRPQDAIARPGVYDHDIQTPECVVRYAARSQLPRRVSVALKIGQISGACYLQGVTKL